MTITDELLMAYADGELDADARTEIERALATNPELARKVESHRALRNRLRSAFDPVLNEPLPAKLIAAIDDRAASDTTNLAAYREKKSSRLSRIAAPRGWLSIAASIALGVLVGYFTFTGGANQIVARDGRVVNPRLVSALNEQASGESDRSPVAIGISYVAKSGDYCRSFIAGLQSDARPLAGVACQGSAVAGEWKIRMLVAVEGEEPTDYRTATSAIPTAVVELIDREIEGDPLDTQQESSAIAKRWKR